MYMKHKSVYYAIRLGGHERRKGKIEESDEKQKHRETLTA